MTLRYRVDLSDRLGHRFRVTLDIPAPAAETIVGLPVWAPGSYLVREFARHLIAIRAEQGGRPVAVEQIDKASWRVCSAGRTKLRLHYEVHGLDRSVRTAWLDATRAFFNGPALLLRVQGREAERCELALTGLPRGWEVATAMAPDSDRRGVWRAADYDDLVDHPFEIGPALWRGAARAGGVDLALAVSGAWPRFDGERLLADLRRIVATQVAFWHGRGQPPFPRYTVLLHACDEGYGGLEHRASAALIAARRDLPRIGEKAPTDGYAGLLGLISHEVFHAWHVVRLRPREFRQRDYTQENYTRLLWFFEGATSYYDDLLLVRAGLVDAPRYLKGLARTVNGLRSTPGRHVQSVAQASFEAWTKFYRADENTPNTTVSYYAKGALVALALDLTLRAAGSSLDDVMRRLWQCHAADGIGEADIAAALSECAGRSLDAELAAWVHGTGELPLQPLLRTAGVAWHEEAAGLGASLGLRLSEGAVTGVQVKHVLRGGAAEAAGIAPGDELLAVDGWRVRRFDDARHWTAPGAAIEVLAARDGRIVRLNVAVPAAAATTVALSLDTGAEPGVLERRRDWLGA